MITPPSAATRIEVDDRVPAIRLFREFDAPPSLVFRAHTDPDLFARWIGPHQLRTTIEVWDCRAGGEWRYTSTEDTATGDGTATGGGNSYSFRGCFHTVTENSSIVQTFAFGGFPDAVSLERITFQQLADGRTVLAATSLVESFEARDAMVASGMEHGVNEGYQKLDALLAGLASEEARS